MSETISVARGSLRLSNETYERYFSGLEAVVLQRRADDLVVLPVRQASAGGLILKRRNARGDRVVSAGDFFRSHGLEDERELHAPVVWDAAAAGLLAGGLFGADGREP